MPTFTDNKSGKFTKWTAATLDLVVGKKTLGAYLAAMLAKRLGIKPDAVTGTTAVTIPLGYANAEGVLPSMTDQPGFVKGLRIDLQKAQVVGGINYATVQVQWGTGMDGKQGGAYAGALVRTDMAFTAADLRQALTYSADSQSYWRIDP